MSDARTIAFYDSEAPSYAKSAQVSADLAAFAALLPKGAAVLDLGCGAGQDSAALRQLGFNVTSVDASLGLAQQARQRGVDVRVLDIAALDYDAAFDGVWARGSLHHLDCAALPAAFAAIRRALRGSSLLHAAMKKHPADRRDKFDRFFCRMDEADLAALVSDWSSHTIGVHAGGGYDGEATDWLMLRARR